MMNPRRKYAKRQIAYEMKDAHCFCVLGRVNEGKKKYGALSCDFSMLIRLHDNVVFST